MLQKNYRYMHNPKQIKLKPDLEAFKPSPTRKWTGAILQAARANTGPQILLYSTIYRPVCGDNYS